MRERFRCSTLCKINKYMLVYETKLLCKKLYRGKTCELAQVLIAFQEVLCPNNYIPLKAKYHALTRQHAVKELKPHKLKKKKTEIWPHEKLGGLRAWQQGAVRVGWWVSWQKRKQKSWLLIQEWWETTLCNCQRCFQNLVGLWWFKKQKHLDVQWAQQCKNQRIPMRYEYQATEYCFLLLGLFLVIIQSLSHLQLFMTPWTTACQSLCPPLYPESVQICVHCGEDTI